MPSIKKVNPYGYYDRALQQHFPTTRSKREFMKEHGIMEEGSMESDNHRRRRLHEEVEEYRKTQGLKPRSWKEYEEKRQRHKIEDRRR